MKYKEAIAHATLDLMNNDDKIIVLGEGVADPKGIFGTTKLAREVYPDRVIETPLSENMLTGALAGLASEGYKPIYVHARAEFSLLGMQHMVNTIAKWPWLHGGEQLPITIRMLVGRGWGQGPTHSQSFHSMFASVPGLRVLYPVLPQTVYGWFTGAVESGQPTIFIEPRRMYDEVYISPPLSIDQTCTILTIGDGVIEAIQAARFLARFGIRCEVFPVQDFNSYELPCRSNVNLVVETSSSLRGVGAEIANHIPGCLMIGPLDAPLGTAARFEREYYPTAKGIAVAIWNATTLKPFPAHEFTDRTANPGVRKEAF